MHMECGSAVLVKHSTFSTKQCRKYNFVLIDAKVEVLPTFSASMKAKVHLHQSMYLFYHVYSIL